MAEPDDFKDFESLPPEERIKRLKEFEEKKKKEIAEAERMVEDSKEEIKEETRKKEQMPIDQMKVFDENMLRSSEEKEMVKAKLYISDDKDESSDAEQDMLEEVLQKEKPKPLPEGTLQQYGQKIDDLKGELYKIEDRAEAGNSMYEDKQRAYEIHDQLEDMNQEYRSTADAIQHTISVGDRVIDKIKGSYQDEPRRPEQ